MVVLGQQCAFDTEGPSALGLCPRALLLQYTFNVYGDAVLNIALNDEDPRFGGFLSQIRDPAASGTLDIRHFDI